MNEYIFHSDRIGKAYNSVYVKQECKAIRRKDGKCIRGRNSNMLVEFDGVKVVIPARMLRKIKKRNLLKSELK